MGQITIRVNETEHRLDLDHEDDPHLNPMGSKGIGEIGIVGDLPSTPARLLG